MIAKKLQGRVLKSGDDACNVPVGVELVYDEVREPLAVQMVFAVNAEPDIVWTFALQLLAGGLGSYTTHGTGDVRVRNIGLGQLLVCLRNEDGHADVSLPVDPVGDFLAVVQELQSTLGDDHLDNLIDQELKELLG